MSLNKRNGNWAVLVNFLGNFQTELQLNTFSLYQIFYIPVYQNLT